MKTIKLLLLVLFIGAIAKAESPKDHPKHPFLFYSSEKQLREEARTTHKRYFERLKQFCDKELMNLTPISPDSLSDSHDIRQVYFENASNIIIDLSLLFVLTQDEIYKNKAMEWIDAYCDYPMSKIGNDGGYHVGTFSTGLGVGYDMLYNYLSKVEKERIKKRLIEAVELGMWEVDNAWWSKIQLHHDHWVPVGGVGIGAAALYGEVEQSKEWMDHIKESIAESARLIGNDGAWSEGAADWTYAMYFTYPFFDTYKRLTGEDLFKQPYIENAILYRIYNYLPNGTYINHHDSFANGRYNIAGSASSHLMRKLASEFNSGYAQWIADEDEKYDFKKRDLPEKWIVTRGQEPSVLHSIGWSYFWYNPSVKSLSPDNLPLYHYFNNQGLMILKSGWSKDDFTFTFTCAPVGGFAFYNVVKNERKPTKSELYHVHTLVNSFNLYANGNYIATPPGEGYQESGSERHNTLTIEGANQMRTPDRYVKMIKMDMNDNYSYMVGDGTALYPDSINLNRWYRHIAYLSPDVFVICDELSVSENVNGAVTAWHMNFDNKINKVLLNNSDIQVIQQSGKNLGAADIHIYSGEEMTIEQKEMKGQWFTYGQVSVSIKDLFIKSNNQQIITVLTALKTPDSKIPKVNEFKDDNFAGVVINRDKNSVASVFVINKKNDKEKLPIKFDVTATDTLDCYFFSLSPDKEYSITATSQPSDNQYKYSVVLTEGTGYKTNTQGSVEVKFTR
jgi:hypothetical protein